MEKLDQSKFLKHFTQYVKIDGVLEKYPTAKYVGQFPLKQKSWTNEVKFTDWCVDVFYEPNPKVELGHGHYFAVYPSIGHRYITGAEHVEQLMLNVYTDSNGDYIYSRYQHDFRSFDEVSIDGGWWIGVNGTDYHSMIGRTLWKEGSCPNGMSVVVKDGEFYRIEFKEN